MDRKRAMMAALDSIGSAEPEGEYDDMDEMDLGLDEEDGLPKKPDAPSLTIILGLDKAPKKRGI